LVRRLLSMADKEKKLSDEERAEREARRRFALAHLRHYPDPVLRMRSREVERFDEDLVRLVERMTELMDDADGVGLAANQIGILQRVFVLRPSGPDEPAYGVINPVITPAGDELETDEEGCLSFQGVQVPVERAVSVKLEAVDVYGNKLELELEGLAARAAQHELDHLDGISLLDRSTAEARREALGILRPRVSAAAAG
jgi:peptide deformylase